MDIIETRLRRMRKSYRKRDKLLDRKSLNDLRKEKREKIMNSYRRLDLDWFQIDVTDDYDLDVSLTDDSKCFQLIIDYFRGEANLNEMFAKNCLENFKKYIKDNEECGQQLIRIEFFQLLSAFIANSLVPNGVRIATLDLIEELLSLVDMPVIKDILMKSRIVSAIMTLYDSYDIELLTKTVKVMHEITNQSNDILLMALNNGYLVFLMNIIKTTQFFRQRKSTETIRSNRLSVMKMDLIREISKSLLSMVFELTQTELFVQLFPAFEKLIHSKDNIIIINALNSLVIFIERNPQSIPELNKSIILSVTGLMEKNNETISSIVIHFWSQLINKIDNNSANGFINLMIESNLFKNFHEILEMNEKNGLAREVANFLNAFIDKFDIYINLMVKFDMISPLINALMSCDVYSRSQLLSTLFAFIMKINSIETFDYVLQNGIIDSLAQVLAFKDQNLTEMTVNIYQYILNVSQRLDRKEWVLNRADNCLLTLELKALIGN